MMKKLLNIILSIILIVSFVPGFASARSQGYESLNFSKDQASAAVADFELANNNENSTNKSTGNEFEACAYYLTDSDYLIKGYEYNNLYFFGYKNSDLEGKSGIVKYNWANTGTNTVATESPFKAASNCEKIIFDKSASSIKPVSCRYWFYGFDYCKEISGLEYLNTSNVADMHGMFYKFANSIHTPPILDVSKWDTSNVIDMSYMFCDFAHNTEKPPILDVSKWDTSNVIDMSYMFSSFIFSAQYSSLLDLSNWDTGKVDNMSYMFSEFAKSSTKPATIYASDKFILGENTISDSMFYQSNIQGGAGTAYDSAHTNRDGACIDIGGCTTWGKDKGYFAATDFAYYIKEDVQGYYANTFYFFGYRNSDLEEKNGVIEFHWANTMTNINDAISPFKVASACEKIIFDKSVSNIKPASCCCWFYEFDSCKEISGLEYINTSNVTDMSYMFNGYANNVPISTTLNISNWDTSKVVNMSYMFSNYACNAQISINLDLSKWDTSNVADMSYMFSNYACNARILLKLDVSNWDTSNVINMSYMFNGFAMYSDEPATIYASDKFVVKNDANSKNMFLNSRIRGGAGTTYDPEHINADGACIDKHDKDGNSIWGDNKGYFTGNASDTEKYTIVFKANLSERNNSVKNLQKSIDVAYNDSLPSVVRVPKCQGYIFTGFSYSYVGANGETLPIQIYNNKGELFKNVDILGFNDLPHKIFLDANWTEQNSEIKDCAYYVESTKILDESVRDLYQDNTLYFFGYVNSDLENKVGVIKYGWATRANSFVSPFLEAVKCTKIVFDESAKNINPQSCQAWFNNFKYCEEISGLEYLNVSNVKSMKSMFSNFASEAKTAPKLDLRSWDIKKVNDKSYMFSEFSKNTSEPGTIYVSDRFFDQDNGDYGKYDYMFSNSNIQGGAGTMSITNPSINGRSGACIDKLGSKWGKNKGYFTGDKVAVEFFAISADGTLPVTAMYDLDSAFVLPNMPNLTFHNGLDFIGWAIDNPSGEIKKPGDIIYLTKYTRVWAMCANAASGYAYYLNKEISGYEANTLYFYGKKNNELKGKPGVIQFNWADTGYYIGKSPFADASGCTKIVFDQSTKNIKPVSCDSWFYNFVDCVEIDGLENLDTSNVANMSHMFHNFAYNVQNPPTLDVSKWNTSNVTDMSHMFYDFAYSAQSFTPLKLDVSNWDTSSVKNTSYMFFGFAKTAIMPATIYASEKFVVRQDTISDMMFYEANVQGGAGTSFDYDHINANAACIDMPNGTTWGKDKGYFTDNLKYLISFNANLSCDINFIKYLKKPFYTTFGKDLDSFVKVPECDGYIFEGYYYSYTNADGETSNIQIYDKKGTLINGVNIWGFDNLNTEIILNAKWTECEKELKDCAYYVKEKILNYDANTLYFYGYKNLKLEGKSGVTKYSWADTGTNIIKSPFADASGCTKVVFDESVKNIKPVSCCCWFYNFVDCVEIDGLENLDTSNVTNMSHMFHNFAYNVQNSPTLDVSKWNTSNVTDMSHMFHDFAYSAQSFTPLKLDVSNWDTSSVKNTSYMFFGFAKTAIMPATIYASEKFVVRQDTISDMMFYEANVQGGAGTFFDYDHINADAACIDMPNGTTWGKDKGYFTLADFAYYVRNEIPGYNANTLYFFGNNNTDLEGKDGVIKYNWADTGTNIIKSPFADASGCTKVVFDESVKNIKPVSCCCWFYNFVDCVEIDGLENLDTSNVIDMSRMFSACASFVSSLPVTLNVSNWDTSKVVNMSHMFSSCVQNINTSITLDLGKWDTSSVTDMSYMFSLFSMNAQNPPILNVSNWDTSKVENMSFMFNGFAKNSCEPATIYASDKFVVGKGAASNKMFSESNIQGGTGTISLNSGVNDKLGACVDMPGGTIWGEDKGYFTGTGCVYYLNKEISDYEINTLYFYGNNNSDLEGKDGVTKYNLVNLGTYIDKSPFKEAEDCKKIVFHESISYLKPVSCCSWFKNFRKCASVDGLENLDTSNVIDMSYMFNDFAYSAETTPKLNISEWNTSSVENMSYMFSGFAYSAKNYSSLDVSKWDTSSVTDMSYMFNDFAYSAETTPKLDISEWNTSNVKNMSYMFSGFAYSAKNYSSLDVSKWDTSSVTDMSYMFNDFAYSAETTPKLNISEWNTSSVENMSYMFSGFAKNSTEPATIYASDKFVVHNGADSKNMFLDSKIKGGAGTTYDSEHINADAACIDMPNGTIWGKNKGYLTAENVVKADVYTISFNTDQNLPNGIKAENKPSSIQVVFGSVITESINPPTCNNFEFDGFYYTEDGNEFSTEKLYFNADGSPVENTFWDIPSDATLVAHWINVSNFRVHLEKNGGNFSENFNKAIPSRRADLPGASEISKNGHTFAGWFTNDKLTEGPVSFVENTDIEDVYFWAKWIKNSYRISFNANLPERVNSVKYVPKPFYASFEDELFPKLDVVPKCEGYVFDGFYYSYINDDGQISSKQIYDNAGGLVKDVNIWALGNFDNSHDEIILSANWIKQEVSTYEISFSSNFSEEVTVYNMPNPIEVTFGTPFSETVSVPECAGYAFAGFYYVKENQSIDDGIKYFDSEGNFVAKAWNIPSAVTLVAKWDAIFYDVSFDLSLPEGVSLDEKYTLNPVKASLGSPLDKLTSLPQWTGHKFAGFYYVTGEGESRTEKQYFNSKGEFVVKAWNIPSSVTLVAKWDAIFYDVSFDLSLPEGATLDEKYTLNPVKASLGSPLDNLTSLPQWTGHKFAGFYYVKENQSIDDGIKYFDSEGKFVAKAWNIPSAVTLVAKWDAIFYDVSFDLSLPEGVSLDEKYTLNPVKASLGSPLDKLTSLPQWTGHKFAGFYYVTGEGESRTEKQYFNSKGEFVVKAWNIPSSVTLVAKWDAIFYDVSFDLSLPEGATLDEKYTLNPVKASLGSPLDNLTSLPQWTGHKFAGFYYVKENQSIDDGIKYFDSEGKFVAKAWNIPSAVTLVAKWDAIFYDVSFDLSLPEGVSLDEKYTLNPVKASLGSPLDKLTSLPQWTGHKFAGFYYVTGEGESRTEKQYFNSKGEFVVKAWNIPSSVTLVAKWDAIFYDVSFDLSLPEGATLDEKYTLNPVKASLGSPLDNLTSLPQWTGHKFAGFYYVKENQSIDDGIKYFDSEGKFVAKAWNIPSAVTLVAKWDAISYDIFLNTNAPIRSTVNYEIDSIKATYGTQLDDLKSIPECKGHKFAGFYYVKENQSIDDGIKYFDSEGKFVAKAWDIPSAVTLVAKWDAIFYDVSFDLSLPEGATFDEKYTLNPVKASLGSPLDNLTSLPQWSGHKFAGFYYVTGEGESRTEKQYFNSKGEFVVKAWNIPSSVTLVAKWDAIFYDVSFDTNGGNFVDDTYNVTSYTSDKVTSLPTEEQIIKVGYSFMGWYSDSEFKNGPVYDIPLTAVGEKKFWAKWEAVSYIIDFNLEVPNGNSVDCSLSPLKVTYGTQLKDLETVPKCDGYTFKGFYYVNSKDDSEKLYFNADGTAVENLVWDFTNNVVLVAKWEENSYTLTLNTNGGVIDNKFIIDSYIHGQTTFLPSKGQITKEGFIFEGWYYNEKLTGRSIVSISGEATGNKVFWAKWKKVNHRQHFCGFNLLE